MDLAVLLEINYTVPFLHAMLSAHACRFRCVSSKYMYGTGWHIWNPPLFFIECAESPYHQHRASGGSYNNSHGRHCDSLWPRPRCECCESEA